MLALPSPRACHSQQLVAVQCLQRSLRSGAARAHSVGSIAPCTPAARACMPKQQEACDASCLMEPQHLRLLPFERQVLASILGMQVYVTTSAMVQTSAISSSGKPAGMCESVICRWSADPWVMWVSLGYRRLHLIHGLCSTGQQLHALILGHLHAADGIYDDVAWEQCNLLASAWLSHAARCGLRPAGPQCKNGHAKIAR